MSVEYGAAALDLNLTTRLGDFLERHGILVVDILRSDNAGDLQFGGIGTQFIGEDRRNLAKRRAAKVARRAGLEPATVGFEARYSIQLS